jgi:hypothetical protein
MVSKNENMIKLKKYYKEIFLNNDPFGKVFNDFIEKKVLLFPTEGFYLSKKQYEILLNTLKIFLEQEIYISEIEIGDASFESSEGYSFNHNIIKVDTSYEDYLKLPIFLENIMYSSSKTWGVIISHENHAVLGGSEELISKFSERYNCNEDKKKFLKYWNYNKKRYNSNLSWQKDFLLNLNN